MSKLPAYERIRKTTIISSDPSHAGDEEWEITFKMNIHAMFYLTKAAGPAHVARKRYHQYRINQRRRAESDPPSLCYNERSDPEFHGRSRTIPCTKRHPRHAVAPGPIWTPLIPSTMSEDTLEKFGTNVPMGRPGQPAELASGGTIVVTGGRCSKRPSCDTG
jgi:NAD(P)-dependent dehydrogenase (short-subunit alcohol dehydrogenase family)